jgi:L-lactate dehydrogenase complex protein LldG
MAATSSTRETILAKIRRALAQPVPLPFPGQDAGGDLYAPPAYADSVDDLVEQVQALILERGWKEVFCAEDTVKALLSKATQVSYSSLPLEQSDVSITSCEALVARTGSMVLSARTGGRTTSVYAPVHICVALTSQLVYDVRDALQLLKTKYPDGLPSQISFATGPSRTADIEKTLVVGVHGPKEVYCFLLEDH